MLEPVSVLYGPCNSCGFASRRYAGQRVVPFSPSATGNQGGHLHDNRSRLCIALARKRLVDRRFQVKLRNRASSEGTDQEEQEANLFAAELLMPASFLEEDLEELDPVDLEDEAVIAMLAKRYKVSTRAMTFRLAYLNHLEL